MARRLVKDGVVVALEFNAGEFAQVLDIELDQLLAWSAALPATRGENEQAQYQIKGKRELNLLRQRAAVLGTGMTEEALAAIEEAGMLEAYAALAEDCPEGITAHIWRSYGLIVLMQGRYQQMIGPEELAERASLLEPDGKGGKPVPSVEMATRHIRILQALGYLTPKDGRWEHRGLPRAWR